MEKFVIPFYKVNLLEIFKYNIYSANFESINDNLVQTDLTIRIIGIENLNELKNGDFSIRQMEKYLANNAQYVKCLTFYNGNAMVGYIFCFLKKSFDLHCKVVHSDLYFTDFCVFNEYRGKGLSKQCLSACLNYFYSFFNKDYKISFICRSYNTIANSLYLRLGFPLKGKITNIKVLGKSIRFKKKI